MDDLKSTITDIAGNVAKRSSQLLKSTKLSMSLSSEEQKLRNLYIEIGRKVHEIYTYGGKLGDVFDDLYYKLRETEQHIRDIKKEIAEAKGVMACPKCGSKIDREADFCPKCGEQMGLGPPPKSKHGAPMRPQFQEPQFQEPQSQVPQPQGPQPQDPQPQGPQLQGPQLQGPQPQAPQSQEFRTQDPWSQDPRYQGEKKHGSRSYSAPSEKPEARYSARPDPQAKICPICGKKNVLGERFCVSCGRVL